MPPKLNKKTSVSLYKTFIDAYLKAHRNDEPGVRHRRAIAEWNELKWNEEYVKEKIEEYLETFNQLVATQSNIAVEQALIPRRSSKANKDKSDASDDLEEEDQDQDEEQEQEEEKKSRRKSYFTKPPSKATEDEINIDELTKMPSAIPDIALEPLAKEKRQPAQERVFKELSSINERIASLIQIRQMGLLTAENRKQLKQLMADRRKKAFELRRLQLKVKASHRYRDKRRKIVENLFETKPELRPKLKKLYRPGGGRPTIEEQYPDLLQTIEEIAKVGGASDCGRRSEIIRPCITLDDLREKLRQRGYYVKRTTLYYRLLPHRINSIDGRRHVHTVPVRLRRAQNDEHGKHDDGHFAAATIRYVKDLISIFGNDCVLYISQDDKCKVPIGLPAARAQAPMLMHLDYRVRLPDHDWTVAPRHQLTPSVYAACLLSSDGTLSHCGPTYIAIRSAKHDLSSAESHAADFDRLTSLKEFENIARDKTNQVKPIVVFTVDGGPDENPRFPKTLVACIKKFKKYNLDALFVLTYAPGQSAYNIVEHRMAPLSHDMAGLILPHDFYGSHLSDSGVTTNIDLEKMNFRKAGEILAETWNQTVVDGFSCVAEYINPPATTEDERRQSDIKYIIDSLLREICADEEAEEGGHEHRVSARDEYHQENARPAREKLSEPMKYDIDEYWCATHVLQTQYTLQIIRCNSISCCGPWRSNYVKIFPHRFLPSPVPFERTIHGIRVAEKDYQKGIFYGSLFQRIQFHGIVIQHTQNEMLPFDYCCASVKKELKKRTCQICNQYIPSAYRMKNHYKIHAQHYDDFDHDQDHTLPPSDNAQSIDPTSTKQMLDWLQSDTNVSVTVDKITDSSDTC